MTALGLSMGLFAALLGLLYLPLLGPRDEHDAPWIRLTPTGSVPQEVPFAERLSETETISLSTELEPGPARTLCFTGLNATALTAAVDGVPVLVAGDHAHPTANLWTSMIVVPLPEIRESGAVLTLTMSGTQLLALNHRPDYESPGRAVRRAAMHRLIYHDMLVFFMGAAVLVGVLLIGFSTQEDRIKIENLLLGVSSLLIAFHALDYTYRLSTGPFPVYSVLKRLMMVSGYLASLAYLAGLDHHRSGRFAVSRWFAIPTLAAVILIGAAPNLARLHARMVVLNMVLVLNLAAVVVLIYRRMRGRAILLIAGALVALAIIQVSLVMTVLPGMPAVVQYVVVMVAILFGLQYLLDYREIIRERENLRKAYNRDPLTDAYNRRALSDVNLSLYSSAAFLDLDSFKYYNDRYGHEEGDRLLRDFVGYARSQLRRDDIVIRYGGDEFLILLKEADEAVVTKAIERLRNGLKTIVDDEKIDVSYGIRTIGPGGSLDIADLDKSMYAMKMAKRRS